jgi:hypothetical protein
MRQYDKQSICSRNVDPLKDVILPSADAGYDGLARADGNSLIYGQNIFVILTFVT